MTFIIADDFPLSVLGTQVLLQELGHTVSGTFNNGKSAWKFIKLHQPDFAILDISMPEMDGLKVAEEIRLAQLPTKIILLTSHKEKSIYKKAEELKINAYILKQFALEELKDCVTVLMHEEKYLSPRLKNELYLDNNYLKSEDMSKLNLSERKVFELVVQQKSTKEISACLFLSEKTIEAHRAEIIRKLEIEPGKNALLKYASKYSNSN